MRISAPVARISASALGEGHVFGGRGRRGRGGLGGQILALVGVEDREALEKGDGIGFLARLLGARPFAIGNEAIGIDDRRAFLALAHMAAEAERLAEGEPALAGEATLGDAAPQDEDTDGAVSAAGRGVLRKAEGGVDAALPQGCTQGTRPASSSAMIFSVTSWYRLCLSGKVLRIVPMRGSPRRAGESLSLASFSCHGSRHGPFPFRRAPGRLGASCRSPGVAAPAAAT
jgi:hypothetical protein